MSGPRISLIICTYNRDVLLPRCLEAAVKQSLAPPEYEVIVVDNGSTDDTRAVVERHGAARYIYFGERGLSLARNAGAHAARAPVIAYIDDDAIAETGLLERLLAAYDRFPDAACVGGRIDIVLPPELPSWYSDHFAGYYSQFRLEYAEPARVSEMWEYPFGANVSFRREALGEIGYFSTRLGRVGRGTAGGEELDAECRLALRGHSIYYHPGARVEHIILPDRLKWSHIANSAQAAGRNWAYYENELLRRNQGIGSDMRLLAGAWSRMAHGENFWVAYSQSIFYRAKIMRKIRYKLSRTP